MSRKKQELKLGEMHITQLFVDEISLPLMNLQNYLATVDKLMFFTGPKGKGGKYPEEIVESFHKLNKGVGELRRRLAGPDNE